MSGNSSQIFSRVGSVQWGTVASNITAANTAKDGTGTVSIIFIADATNGGRVEQVRWQAQGTNVASVGRIFVNNGSTNGTALNNAYLCSISLPATTNTETAALPDQVMFGFPYPFPLVLNPGFRLLAVLGTAVAAGWVPVAIGGAY